MADATATFVINLDTSSGQSAGTALGSNLEQLKAKIIGGSKALTEMQGSMQRLRGAADVLSFEKVRKGLVLAQSDATKLQSKLAALQAKLSSTTDIKAGKGLQSQIANTQGALGLAQSKAASLTGQREKLMQSASVKAYLDTASAIKSKSAALAEQQTQFSRLGGSMTEAAEKAWYADTPVASIVERFGKLKAMGAPGVFITVAVAAVATAAAIGGALLVLGKFVLGMSDAARTTQIFRDATAGSAEGGAALAASIERVQNRVGGAREELEQLALDLRRLGLEGQNLESSIEAVRATSRVFGQQVGSTIQGVIDRAQRFRAGGLNLLELRGTGLDFKDVAQALAKNTKWSLGVASSALANGRVKVADFTLALRDASRVKTGAALEKLALALPEQMERAQQNVAKIFKLDPGKFLKNLSEVLGVLDQSTATGKKLHAIMESVFQPLLDSEATKGFMQDMVLLTVNLAIGFLRIAVGVKEASDALKKFTGGVGILDLPTKVDENRFSFSEAIDNAIKDPSSLLRPPQMAAGTKPGGAALVDGIVAGIDERTPALMKKMEGLGPASAQHFDKGIERRSPSRLFRMHARDIPRGVALGVEDETPKVASAIASMASPEDLNVEASGGGGRRGSGDSVVNVTAYIDARGSSSEDVHGNRNLLDALVEVLEDAVRKAGLGVGTVRVR